MRGQAFITDGLFALFLALSFASILGVQQVAVPSYAPLRLARACYDLSSEFYHDGELYGNVTLSLRKNASLSNESLCLLQNRTSHFARLLGLEMVDFEVNGIQAARIFGSSAQITAVERCCFPIVDGEDGVAYVACYEVGA